MTKLEKELTAQVAELRNLIKRLQVYASPSDPISKEMAAALAVTSKENKT